VAVVHFPGPRSYNEDGQARGREGKAMLSLRRPTEAAIREFLAGQSGQGLTYAAVGATATGPPAGSAVDHTRVRLGTGEDVFRAARAALEGWAHFRLGWVETWPPGVPLRPGEVVAVLARAVGLWWLSACRVVYAVDEDGPVRRFGFAYGTLPDHPESGEERFLVEWDKRDGGVWYDVLAFSRPRAVVARLGYPWVRRLQKRFGRDSAAAMRRAVDAAGK
jgi:uncharacterized protein (UPF0548 family)